LGAALPQHPSFQQRLQDAGIARKPRLHVPGGVYHVMLRGNGGQAIFFTEEDRLHFHDLAEEGTARFAPSHSRVLAQGQRVHLVVQVAETPLAKIVQNLSFRYTRRVHRRPRTVGHLFQGCYKAILVDADAYLLTLVRYVHLNPVRAGLVAHAEDYRWSGHRTYLGLDALPWPSTGWVPGQFAKRLATELSGPSRARRVSEARGMAGRLALETGATTLSAVAPLFHRDPTTLSRVVGWIDGEAKTSRRIAERLKPLRTTSVQA